ncbi:glycosyltransferase [Streptomyces sp. NPDC049949]|uniref:glycosyltransferase n=1 Tax=Streptomyces sp. NPDC049949 TaxID=3154627 RepID=UPI00342777D0
MRILIAAAGSRGDVAPYTGLGAALRGAGHEVALAATESFAYLAAEAGLEFRPLPADHRAHGGVRNRHELLRAAAAFMTHVGEGLADAVAEGADLPTGRPAGLTVTGSWWPYVDADAELPADLEDFLAAGPRPVLVGFGSMAAGEGERLGGIAVRALRRAGLRGVLQSGSAGLAADGDDILTVGDVPHSLLFPRLAAVVHHAGAGTSAAALRAGVPSVTVPVAADQPFWAARLASIGAATTPVPFRSLTAERLADALAEAVREPSYARAATAATRHMAPEDGTGAVITAVERSGPS